MYLPQVLRAYIDVQNVINKIFFTDMSLMLNIFMSVFDFGYLFLYCFFISKLYSSLLFMVKTRYEILFTYSTVISFRFIETSSDL